VATSPQRAYRAACPNCGAPVEFVSAASASAVCSYCRSTLVRDGQALRRIGVSAELFEDFSPLQLGATGRYQGEAFGIVGRLQYGYAEGTWNEWHALFDNGKSGWLSEDNGAYVFAFEAPLAPELPRAETLSAGARLLVGGQAWDVASAVRAHLVAAQGELPTPPRLDGEFWVADLRNAAGEVGTLDESDPEQRRWYSGRSVRLADLALQGLRETSESSLAGKGFECPSCGTSLELKLSTTQSIACHQCKAVVDVSQGIGADLHYYGQNNSGQGGLEPQIALGKTGRLALGGPPVEWQVVGYLERCDIPAPDSDDEQTFWREYLLFNQKEGFAFLVDAEEGWSWVKPITGTPKLKGDTAVLLSVPYKKRFDYAAKVTWVLGEFYWRIKRDEVAEVSDYHSTGPRQKGRLSREKVANEVTWSAGEVISAAAVAEAFGIPPGQRGALERDVAPLASIDGAKVAGGIRKAMIALFVVAVVISLLAECSGSDCDEVAATFGNASTEYRQCIAGRGGPRTGGGAFGGYSSGGGHK
jgi:hypothetical protein